MIRPFILCALALIFTAGTAHSQQNLNYTRFLQTLSEINRINPLQNPEYDREDEILERRVLDSKNKVVGNVEDVVLHRNGNISSLNVDFNRLRLGRAYLNYRDLRIQSVSDGYALNFDYNQIEEIYPSLLAGVETAAGDRGDSFSVKSLKGAPVKSRDGRKIGEVRNVLFNSRGARAEALYVAMLVGIMRGKSVAIPYGAVEYRPAGRRTEVLVSDDQAEAMKDFARD